MWYNTNRKTALIVLILQCCVLVSFIVGWFWAAAHPSQDRIGDFVVALILGIFIFYTLIFTLWAYYIYRTASGRDKIVQQRLIIIFGLLFPVLLFGWMYSSW